MNHDELNDHADQEWLQERVMGVDAWIGVTLLTYAFGAGFVVALLLGAMR